MKTFLITLSLLLVLSFIVPIRKFWVDDRWVYGYDESSGRSINSQTQYLTIWEYVSAKHKKYLYKEDLTVPFVRRATDVELIGNGLIVEIEKHDEKAEVRIDSSHPDMEISHDR